MTQIFSPAESSTDYQKLYCYTNKFHQAVVVKIRGLMDRNCERVVFPQEKFLFEANDECQVEIIQTTITGIIKDNIPCSQLQVIDEERITPS